MTRCLIVIDFQKDFISGSLGFPEAENLAAPIAEKIRSYRENGDSILFTFDTHDQDYLETQEGKHLPIEHCIRGTEGHRLHPEIEKLRRPEDICFKKNTFGSIDLCDYMRQHKFSSIELCGLVSNICVISNAVICKTAQPETPIYLDPRCTAAADPEANAAAIKVMEGLQVNIIAQE